MGLDDEISGGGINGYPVNTLVDHFDYRGVHSRINLEIVLEESVGEMEPQIDTIVDIWIIDISIGIDPSMPSARWVTDVELMG